MSIFYIIFCKTFVMTSLLRHTSSVRRIFKNQRMGLSLSRPSPLTPLQMDATKIKTDRIITENSVVVFSKSYCPYCRATKDRLSSLQIQFFVMDLDQIDDGDAIQNFLAEKTNQRSVPNIFIGEAHIGGNSDLQKINDDQLLAMVEEAQKGLHQ
ncbi:Glutaredoxin [Neolecta irregularis DAH-3]|uniref:Glutaredoxin n=1 Tax=Neolecta irregularis (strain DAH-3) TaxID=1198029 RepID=A0A1U7LGD4_NEOID|nr:Glutaredoxin [Neolecta irregularis DAH-3]|eukprot:OLL21714.1 Glutaredoxin [Neolecta irregularis DAH-3]